MSERDIETAINVDEFVSVITPRGKESNLCYKLCAAIFLTVLLCPFIICDLYFALTDTSCIDQSLKQINLNMRTYLIVSASIGIVSIAFINITILICDYDNFEIDTKNIFLRIIDYLYKLFTLSWLIVGCVMFWNLMDTSICTTSVYNYLFARFVLTIVSYALVLSTNEQKSK
jgi:hypothetical protein